MQLGRTILALAAAAALVTGACAGGRVDVDDTDAATPAAQVTILSFIYDPTPLEVDVGTTVTWSNEDKILHTATAGTPDSPTGVFDIEMAEVGTSGDFTFDEAGTYEYFCSRHNTMRGQVVVS